MKKVVKIAFSETADEVFFLLLPHNADSSHTEQEGCQTTEMHNSFQLLSRYT